MGEVIDWLRSGNADATCGRACGTRPPARRVPASLRRGNGRIFRIVQPMVLAMGGLPAPEFVTIEEYLGENTAAYYGALQAVQ
jgi:hypothetical protein